MQEEREAGERYKERKGGEGRENGGKDGQREEEELTKITRKGRAKCDEKSW